MANMYTVRIHEYDETFRERVASFMNAVGGSYVMVREIDAERPHYQGWVRTDIKDQAFRVRVKKAFPECVGNKGYSVGKVRDAEAYSRYVLKGTREETADVVCACGLEITPEYLADQHRAYWSVAEKPVKSNRSLVEEVHEWVVESMKYREVSRRDIANRIVETMASRKKGINTFYCRAVTNTVQWLTNHESREIILDEIVNKY